MAENYDKLSDLGEHQARKLGEFWLARGVAFDLVFQGPAERHKRTAAIVADVYRAAGAPWPEHDTVSDLDEFDALALIRTLAPLLMEMHEPVRDLHHAFERGAHSPNAGSLLERLFQEVARHWAIGSVLTPDVESWQQFSTRVARGVRHIRCKAPKSSNSVAFTSGGTIAATLGFAQELAPHKAMDLVWVSRNSSYSEFLFSGERFSLTSFNTHPHLDDRALLTYR